MKRAIDVTEDQLELWVNRAGTDTNLRQRKTFSDIRNYLDKKMNDLIQEKPTVS
jgi:Zn-dependent M16 (insulinase) family peptidase